MGAGAGAGVRARETVEKGVKIFLLLVGASGRPLASSLLPLGGRLRQGLWRVRDQAI